MENLVTVQETIETKSLGMKHYLLFVGFAIASKNFHDGTDEFIKNMIDVQLKTKYKTMYSGNREEKRHAEKLYKKHYKRLYAAHNRYGKILGDLVAMFDDGTEYVETEGLMSAYISEFADAFVKARDKDGKEIRQE